MSERTKVREEEPESGSPPSLRASAEWLVLLATLVVAVSACQDEQKPICHNGVNCDWVYIAATQYTGCAIRAEGTAWCWGSNSSGQVGDGTTTYRDRAVKVTGIDSVVGMATGWRHTCATLADGSLWCWGANHEGQVGDDTTEKRPTPVQIPMQTDVAAVHAYRSNTFVLLTDGTVWQWGEGFGSITPQRFADIDDVVVLADQGGCAVRSDGTAWCWGSNSSGQIGNGTIYMFSDTPAQVVGLSGVVDIDQGGAYACALTDANEAWCWGSNWLGRLGDGTTEDASAPVRVELDDVVSISAGTGHACAIVGDGSAHCWGDGYLGAWDNGDYLDTLRPVQVAKLQEVTRIHAVGELGSDSITYAITADGTLWGWGSILSGALKLKVPESDIQMDSPYNTEEMWVWEPYPVVDP